MFHCKAKEDALKKLAKGGTVVVSIDGTKVSPACLRVFKDDVLVLMSPDLAVSARRNIRWKRPRSGTSGPRFRHRVNGKDRGIEKK